ncbi:MAG TPA: SGNH/GDSL hydrolase family protein [Gemmatirosa sp.]
MTSRHTFRAAAPRAAALAAAALAAAACSRDPILLGTTPPTTAPFMSRYVAIGNSITAGYQSGGINDSTQRRSYAHLLSLASGATTYSYAKFAGVGCPPPIVNFLTGVRVSGDTSSTRCDFRDPMSTSAALNNVAVPGANSWDAVGLGLTPTTTSPASLTTGGYSALTTFILGGQTQLQRAVQLDPTFATIWIGNNDVLAGALASAGDSTKATNLQNFRSNYATLVNGLRSGSPHLKGGVLIGVVDPTNVPLLIPIAVFSQPVVNGAPNPAYYAVQALFGVGTRRPATFQIGFDPSCFVGTPLITFPALAGLAAAIPAAAPGYVFNCSNTAAQTPNLVTEAERQFYANRVVAYNAYIQAKADSIGWVFFDPNPIFVQLRQQGAIPLFPNLAAPTAPFATALGRYITNDGVHPSTTSHYTLANLLITAINTKYGSTIRALVPADTVAP